MNQPINPLASLCLGVVRGWIRVAQRGRGGQIDQDGAAWTRLPAIELRCQLAREFRVEVSTRSVQRALKRLAEANLLRREQRLKHRYWRDYWYALPVGGEEAEAVSPRTISGVYRPSRRAEPVSVQAAPTASQSDKPVRVEATREASQYLYAQIKNTHLYSGGPVRAAGSWGGKAQGKRGEIRVHQTADKGKAQAAVGQRRKPGEGFGRSVAARITSPMPKRQFVELPERTVGVDQHGRPLKEVWVSGSRHLVVD